MQGRLFCSATSWARRCFLTVSGKYEPPLTVASFATITHSRPSTTPIPVTMPPAGAWPSYSSQAASAFSSRNAAPGSTRRSMRSRAVSFPRDRWRSVAFSPPPRAISAVRSRNSATRPSMRRRRRLNSSDSRSTCEVRTAIALSLSRGRRVPEGPGSRLLTMIVGHLDLDAFFAAVEELEDPSLKTKPLVVGGDPHGRGVVATANYVARKFGIHSAMSCAEALRRCPETVFVRPRHSLYREYSQHVWETVRGVVPTVERTGLDEGYLDMGEVAHTFLDARRLAEAVQTAVRAATNLTCALGVSTSKVVAKVASDHRKPGGLTVVPAGQEASFLAPFDVRRLPGVGPKAEERLLAAGVTTIGALAALSDVELRRVLPGSVGRVLHDRARGIDPRGLEQQVQRISISVENTFERDLTDRAQLHAELRRMADRISEMLRGSGRTARTVSTKLRYTDFSIRTRSTSLRVGIDEPGKIGELACALLDRALADRPGALRLVGVGVSGLASHQQLAFV